MIKIIDNGEQIKVSDAQAQQLVDIGMIYNCPGCGNDAYHTCGNHTLDDIEAEIFKSDYPQV